MDTPQRETKVVEGKTITLVKETLPDGTVRVTVEQGETTEPEVEAHEVQK